MPLAMNAAERDQFLAGPHVGVLSVQVTGDGEAGGRGPLTVPVWYSYQPGGPVSVITGRNTRKGQALRAAGRMTLCAQDENPPYRYVSVEGPVTMEELDHSERLAMARRYLGTERGDQYVASNPDPDRQMAVFRMQPQHWMSADFGKLQT